jgi:predicted amidohydrolase YtcJ
VYGAIHRLKRPWKINAKQRADTTVDSHEHRHMVSIDCKVPGMQSIEALQKAVCERAATQPSGTWMRGRAYDQTRLRERRHPTRNDWDSERAFLLRRLTSIQLCSRPG